MVLVSTILYGLFVLLMSTRPPQPSLSLFELKRRQKLHDPKATEALRRHQLLTRLSPLRLPLGALLFLASTLLLVHAIGRSEAIIAALVAGLLSSRIASLQLVRRAFRKLYVKYEAALLRWTERYEKQLRWLTGVTSVRETPSLPGSHQELLYMVEAAAPFSDDDKRLVRSALGFKERTVGETMTPKNRVTTIAYTELLGPLVLDDLHKTGHTLFPVMKSAKVVGLLDTTEHSALHIKESMPVRSVMNTDIMAIRQTVRLEDALETLIKARQQLLIVEDEEGEMAGLLTLTDIVQALIGRKPR